MQPNKFPMCLWKQTKGHLASSNHYYWINKCSNWAAFLGFVLFSASRNVTAAAVRSVVSDVAQCEFPLKWPCVCVCLFVCYVSLPAFINAISSNKQSHKCAVHFLTTDDRFIIHFPRKINEKRHLVIGLTKSIRIVCIIRPTSFHWIYIITIPVFSADA